MANEAQYVTSACGQRIRVVSTSLPHSTQHATRSPSTHGEEQHPRTPAPPPHLTAPAQHYRGHYDRSADRYARAQAMSGNYFSRKPVRPGSPRRQPRPQLIGIPSSPPLQTERAGRSTVPDITLMDCGDHESIAPSSTSTHRRFQSSYRFSGYPAESTHQFQLFPTPVHRPVSFCFELEPVVKNTLAQFHYAIKKAEEGEGQTYKARPGSYCEVSTAQLGIAYSEASYARPVAPGNTQDWEIKAQRAQIYRYDKPMPRYFDETEQFVGAREMLDGGGHEQEQEVSQYLDAVEEKAEDSIEWREGEHMHLASDLSMSDGLPGESAYPQHVHQQKTEGKSAKHRAPGDMTARNMVEVRSTGTAAKMIDAARMKGYRG